jgi:hypothetical protein
MRQAMAQGIPLALVAAGTCFVLWNASWAMQAGSGGGGGGEGGSEKNSKVQARQLSTFQAGVPDEVYGTLEWTHKHAPSTGRPGGSELQQLKR